MDAARDLLLLLLLAGLPALALDGRGPPPLGPPEPAVALGDAQRAALSPARRVLAGGPVDVNHASLEELIALDGVGPRLAARIVAARPFGSLDELARVPGVGARRGAQLRPRLRLQLPPGDGLFFSPGSP